MNLGKWALANSKLIYFLVAILVVGGILSYDEMSKLEDPAIKVKQAMVITTFAGASSYEVELQVTNPIEKAIRSMKGVDKVESQSSANLSLITVYLESTVADSDTEQHWDMLRRKVSAAQRQLPKESSSSVVVDDYGDVFGMFYALTADGLTNHELGEYAELIQREVQNIEGVSAVELYGIHTPTLEIALYEDKLANLGISPAELLQTIQGQNKSGYSGYFESGDSRLRLSVNDKFRTPEELENLLIQGHQEDQVRLGDIASVSKSYANPIRNALTVDNQEAIGISISALSGTDILKVGKVVEQRLEELKSNRLPLGVEYHKVFFQPERVNDALNSFVINLIESVVIVVLVLMFAMGLRSALLLGATLVVTVLGSLLFLQLFDGTLQRVSLASFILAMGMLVDNAIVIVDGILVDSQKGRLRTKSLTEVGKRTAMPLLGATLIAILAFFPIFLSPDTAGVYVRDLFVVLGVSLLLSWILSLTMVPLLAKSMLKQSKQSLNEGGAAVDNRFFLPFRSVLIWGLHHRVAAIVSSILLVGVSLWCYTLLPQSFFPDMNYNQLYIEYKLPEDASSTQTQSDLEKITEYLRAQNEVKQVTASTGATPSRYNLVRSIATPSLSYGDLIVEFSSNEALMESMERIQLDLTEQFPHAYVRVKRYNLMYSKYPIEAMFTGPDPAILRELTDQALAIMNQSEQITLTTSDWPAKTAHLEVEYNQSAARSVGRSRQEIALSLLAATEGIPTATLYNGSSREEILLKCVDREGNPIESLENATTFSLLPSLKGVNRETLQAVVMGQISEEELISQTMATTPLSQSIHGINLKWEDPLVMRYNGERSMRAQGNNRAGYSAEIARSEVASAIEAIPLPEGYTLSWQGEYMAKRQSLKYLFANLPLALVLMVGILILLFKDYRKPLIIFLCVPLLFVGAIFGVMVAGKAFGFVAICGILGLIGMMIRNGVVLMDEITQLIETGSNPVDALIESSAIRFRPVMMASLTTILGMIPLLPDDMFGSLAATIMGGLFVGTVVTLIYIPIFYAILFNIKTK